MKYILNQTSEAILDLANTCVETMPRVFALTALIVASPFLYAPLTIGLTGLFLAWATCSKAV